MASTASGNGDYRLDLLLVNTNTGSQIYQSLSESLTAVEPPIWAGLFATLARRHGHSVAILDAEADHLNVDETAKRVVEMRPRLTAMVVYGHEPSASTQNMAGVSAVTRAAKRLAPNLKCLLVGGHVAALPERTLQEEAADFVSSGEGTYTLLDLLEALKSSQPLSLSKVRGLMYLEGGKVQATMPAPLLPNPGEEMPEVAWDLLPMAKYRAHNWHCFGDLRRQPYAAIYTTLGCPYKCTFCCIQAPFKEGELALGYKSATNSYRFWEPAKVVAQIDKLVNTYGVRNIKFADEMFVLHPKHVGDICDLLIERNYDLNIWAYARVDTVRDGMLDKLKRAGFNWLAFGIEAASERVRADVQKGFDQDLIFQTLERVRQAGINIIGNYIFGLPEDDRETMQETLDLALDQRCEMANFYSAMAYPGSELYRKALEQGLLLPGSWSGYSQHSVDCLPLPTKYISGSEVLAFRDHAFQTYFTDPGYLGMVERRFGMDTVEHIREAMTHRLERRYVVQAA